MTKLYQSGERYFFWCPGCKEPHFYQVSGSPAWQFNGDLESPTFTPSLMTTTRRGERDHVCHLFLTAGNIQFSADCSHEYRAQTVPLPDWEREENTMHRTIKQSKEGVAAQASGPPPAQPAPAKTLNPVFLEVADHVVPGLEHREIVIAKNQPQYRPLPVLPAGDKRGTVLSRWVFDDAARAAVAAGADLYLETLTFGAAFQPVNLFVLAGLDAQTVREDFFAPPPVNSGAVPTITDKKASVPSAPGLEPEAAFTEAQQVEEPHEAHHVKCRACGVWFNKNDPACPNCNERTPIVVGG